ncbi:hypothetical protein [Butyricimonas synergistica]|uniref:hypothetical protein n=1 Tax=Butyricimonas synergistica TaxID=544644 RepID=UPI000362B9F7|nr:hypothetical protein [Butyricimonas synergistica]
MIVILIIIGVVIGGLILKGLEFKAMTMTPEEIECKKQKVQNALNGCFALIVFLILISGIIALIFD